MDGMCPWRFDEKMRSVQLGDSGVTIGKAINKQVTQLSIFLTTTDPATPTPKTQVRNH